MTNIVNFPDTFDIKYRQYAAELASPEGSASSREALLSLADCIELDARRAKNEAPEWLVEDLIYYVA